MKIATQDVFCNNFAVAINKIKVSKLTFSDNKLNLEPIYDFIFDIGLSEKIITSFVYKKKEIETFWIGILM